MAEINNTSIGEDIPAKATFTRIAARYASKSFNMEINKENLKGEIQFKRGERTWPALQFDRNNVANETRFLLYDIASETYRRVSMGAADSGGTGYRVLRVLNI